MQSSDNLFLVAIDFWSPSINALEMAARFATEYKGRILAVHVVEKSFNYPGHLNVDLDTIEEDLEAAMDLVLSPIRERGIMAEFELRKGDVTRQLMESVHDHEAQALFVGLREGRILEDIFIGENTLHLIKAAEVPLVVVESAPTVQEIREVLIPMDRKFGVGGLLDFMESLDHPLAKSALIITAMAPEEDETAVRTATEFLVEQLRGHGIENFQVDIVRDQDPYGAMMDQLRLDVGIFDLVLLEHHNFADLGQLTLGSIVEEVVTKGRMPVVCLPRRN
ncbi:MAG: universal stress protein [Bacteroidia bacterium]